MSNVVLCCFNMKLRCPGRILVIQGKMIYVSFLLSEFNGTCVWTAFNTSGSYNSLFMWRSTD